MQCSLFRRRQKSRFGRILDEFPHSSRLGQIGADHWQTWLASRLSQTGHVIRYPRLPLKMEKQVSGTGWRRLPTAF